MASVAGLLLLASAACSGSGEGGNGGDGGSDDRNGGEAGGGGAGRASGELAVLSYNVAGLPQEVSTENPEEHIPLISPLLDEYDVVVTQEDFDWWVPALEQLDFVNYHDRLRAEATHEHRSAQHPGPDAVGLDEETRPELQVGDGLGMLSRFPLADEERVPWTGCFGGFDVSDGGAADCLAMKGFAAWTVTLEDGVEIEVIDLHAEAGGTDEDQRLQAGNFDQLAEFIAERAEGRALVVAGDTNLHTDSDHEDAGGGADTEIWQRFLERTGLTDACAALDCAETDAIDKLAYRSGGGVTIEATSHDFPEERFRSPAGEDLSDHPPLVVTLRWSAGPEG
ncbi:MAG TPA: endonuclease/exonuclease/phosphatase family protein [Acidimicrobiales bacterium]